MKAETEQQICGYRQQGDVMLGYRCQFPGARVIAKGCMFEASMDQNFQRLGATTPRP
ncbi:MAG: hypothetical protein WCJ41_18425 [Aestuariivirga sp.]|uniref:hypothetical protein n=1 Tax=Aestuariivirga sp. TaxID=2650926 RepID=UPI00301773BD